MAFLSVITLFIKNPTAGYSVYLKQLIITCINCCFFTPGVQVGALRIIVPASSAVPARVWGSAEWIYTSGLNSVHGFKSNKTLFRFKECEWPLKCRTCAHMSCQPAASSSQLCLSQDKIHESGFCTHTAPSTSKCENTSKTRINRRSHYSQKVRKGSPGIKKREEIEQMWTHLTAGVLKKCIRRAKKPPTC